VANLNPLKGLDTLIDALPLTGLPIELNIVGDELDTHAKYANLIKEKVAEIVASYPEITVRFIGKQPASSIRTYLSSCDVFVLPSRSEACPIALLEAMAMARPVIATDVGAVREILPTTQHIFVCRPDSPRELALTIVKLNKHSLYGLEIIAKENRREIEVNFSPASLAANLLNCYQSLLNGRIKF
jgi:glycosyltransferase involved in cell wall biosynthesis